MGNNDHTNRSQDDSLTQKSRGGKVMKKFILLSLIIFLVLSFSRVPLYAQKVEFKASGFIFVASFLGMNVPHAYDMPNWQPIAAWYPPLYGADPLFAPATGRAFDKTRSFMQERAVLRLDASVGKQVS